MIDIPKLKLTVEKAEVLHSVLSGIDEVVNAISAISAFTNEELVALAEQITDWKTLNVATAQAGSLVTYNAETNTISIPVGIQGEQGIQGDSVTISSIVNNLDKSLTITFSDGTVHTTDVLQGEQGVQGVQGIQGIQGLKGDKGDTGEQGIQGLKGLKGDKGDKGDAGEDGVDGADGYTPIKGVDYFDGTDGTSITTVTSNKSGKTTTITVDGDFTNAPYIFTVLDGADGAGSGDMSTAVYDTNSNGIVDNAEKVNGLTVETAVPSGAVFTDTTYTSLSEFTNDVGYITNTALSTKQDTLVSGTNIKTINGTSVLGSGDLVVGGGGVGEFIGNSIAISSDYSALANDDGTDNSNVAIGTNALNASTTESGSVAVGHSAGKVNTGGSSTFVGTNTGYYHTTGVGATYCGQGAGFNSTSGSYNVGIGYKGLLGDATSKLTGGYNIGIGYEAGRALTVGSSNVLIGKYSGYALTSGNKNIFLGEMSGYNVTTGVDNVCIGREATASSATVSNEITLGNSLVTTLRCAVTTITALSDERDKDNIQDLDAGLDFINTLRPIRFDWNMRDGGKVGENDIGFIAQELQQAQIDTNTTIPHLVMDENPDKLEAGYGMLIAPLVKAVQELSSKVDELQSEIEILKGN